MPDWRLHVRERLGALGLGAEREAEVVSELAGHFEDAYEHCLAQSETPEHATSRVISEVSNWSRLSREIRRATGEDPMNERTKNLWLPGVVMLFLSSLLLMYVTRYGPLPVFIWIDPRIPLLLYMPWLVALPLFGAAGACWSRCAGGRARTRILAGVFPVLMLAAVFFVVLPVAIIFEGHGWRMFQLKALVAFTLGWVLIPGAALLLGALPFLRNHSNDSPQSRA